jgi:glutamyl-tRNA reductase
MNESTQTPLLCCIGTNHTSSPIAFREQVYLPAAELAHLLPQIKEQHGLSEVLVLSTCNRFEIYVLSPCGAVGRDSLAQIFCDLQHLAAKSPLPQPEEIAAHTYSYYDQQAIHHLMAVACSIDSMIIGETQITGQVKAAFNTAQGAGTLGPVLSRLGQEVLATVKKVRSQTAIGEKTVSISHAAIDLAKRVFHSLTEHSMLIIGAGEMAQLTAHYAVGFKPQDLYVVNRTLTKAHSLVQQLPFGDAAPLERLPELLSKADIVISASAAPTHLISFATLQKVMHRRQQRVLYLVDIAIPRTIDPRCSSLENVYLFDIDDLQKLVEEHRAERSAAARDAQTIIERCVAQFSQWLRNAAVTPALEGLQHYLDDLLTRELSRTLTGLRFRELSPEQIRSLKNMMAAAAKKMVGDAALALHGQRDIPSQQHQLHEALTRLFAPPPAPKRTKKTPAAAKIKEVPCHSELPRTFTAL